MRQKNFIYLLLTAMLLSCSSGDEEGTGGGNIDPSYTIKVTPSSITFDQAGEKQTKTFSIESEGAWKIEYETTGWISLNKAQGEGNAEIAITSEPNDKEEARDLILTIKSPSGNAESVTVTVKQEGKKSEEIEPIDSDDVSVLKKIMDDNPEHTLDWVIEKKEVSKFVLVSGTGLTFTEINGKQRLTQLDCSESSLKNIDLSDATELVALHCHSNSFVSLDISKNTKLTIIDCSRNKLKKLDVSTNVQMTELICYSNSLSELNVSMLSELVRLYCFENQFSSLNLLSNRQLIVLDCVDNLLSNNSVTICSSVYDNMEFLNPKDDYIYDVIDCK